MSDDNLGERWFDIPETGDDLLDVVEIADQATYRLWRFMMDAEFNDLFRDIEIGHGMEDMGVMGEHAEAAVKESTRPLRDAIHSGEDPLFVAQARRAVFDSGLDRRNFRTKLGILSAHFENLKKWLKKTGKGLKDAIKGGLAPVLRSLGDFFDYLNDLLGSIVKAIPGAEAVKEFKDAIHASVKLFGAAKDLAEDAT